MQGSFALVLYDQPLSCPTLYCPAVSLSDTTRVQDSARTGYRANGPYLNGSVLYIVRKLAADVGEPILFGRTRRRLAPSAIAQPVGVPGVAAAVLGVALVHWCLMNWADDGVFFVFWFFFSLWFSFNMVLLCWVVVR